MKKLNDFVRALTALLLCVALCPCKAFAQENPVSAAIPFTLQASGNEPERPETFTVLLTPQDAPASAALRKELSPGESGMFGPVYERAGVYHYTLSLIKGSSENAVYDEQAYDVTVTVMNEEAGNGLETSVAITKDGSKFDAATFTVSYPPSVRIPPSVSYRTITVRKLWQDRGRTHPESVTIELISEGKVLDSAVLSAENGWSHSWAHVIESGKDWSVRENPVPAKYLVGYSYSGDTVEVCNTYGKTLIQTGQLHWPVWLMGGVGVLLLALGLVLRCARKKRHA